MCINIKQNIQFDANGDVLSLFLLIKNVFVIFPISEQLK